MLDLPTFVMIISSVHVHTTCTGSASWAVKSIPGW